MVKYILVLLLLFLGCAAHTGEYYQFFNGNVETQKQRWKAANPCANIVYESRNLIRYTITIRCDGLENK